MKRDIRTRTIYRINTPTIAQSKDEPTLTPYEIYLDNKAIGFLMFNSIKEELDRYWIYRIMIDKNDQGMGLGKADAAFMIRLAERNHPENAGADQLYKSLGFVGSRGSIWEGNGCRESGE